MRALAEKIKPLANGVLKERNGICGKQSCALEAVLEVTKATAENKKRDVWFVNAMQLYGNEAQYVVTR